jgi:hypothetical protein|tara:strand:+ start:1237 stop:1368 length:132 start_codon:yes stop_codon:yes gene_type:complete
MGTRIQDRGRPTKRPIIRGGVLLPVPAVEPEIEQPKRKVKHKG